MGDWISLLYDGTELLNIFHCSPVVGLGTSVGMAAGSGMWAGGSHQAAAVRRQRRPRQTLPKTVGFGSLQKSRKNSGPIFVELGQKTLNEQVLASAGISQMAYF